MSTDPTIMALIESEQELRRYLMEAGRESERDRWKARLVEMGVPVDTLDDQSSDAPTFLKAARDCWVSADALNAAMRKFMG